MLKRKAKGGQPPQEQNRQPGRETEMVPQPEFGGAVPSVPRLRGLQLHDRTGAASQWRGDGRKLICLPDAVKATAR